MESGSQTQFSEAPETKRCKLDSYLLFMKLLNVILYVTVTYTLICIRLRKCFSEARTRPHNFLLESTRSSEAIAAEVVKFAMVSVIVPRHHNKEEDKVIVLATVDTFSYFVKETELKLLT